MSHRQLLSAAPELLEACEEGLNFVFGNDALGRREWEQIEATFRAAIAKATV